MKLARQTARFGVLVATAMTAITVWGGGAAHADTNWGQIDVADTASSCVALNQTDGFFNDNTRVFQWSCNGNNDQQWSLHFFTYAPDGTTPLYQVINLQSRKCMEVRNDNTLNGTLVDQFTCGTGPAASISTQLWEAPIVSNIGGGTYHRLRPWSALDRGASMCLDIRGGGSDDGTTIEQWTCNGGLNQEFFGIPLNGTF